MNELYLNGKITNKSDAQISIMDRGFLFGDGVYELIPVFNKKIFLLSKHLDRLANSLSLIGMKKINDLDKIIDKLIAKNQQQNFFIYIHITRGAQSQRNHVYPKSIKPTILVMCEEYPCFTQEQIRSGFSACIQDDFRWQKSNIKSISLLGNVLLKNHAADNDLYETLLMRNNKLTEGSASNVFIVKNNLIHTPKLSNELLPGVTRDLLIDLLRKNDLQVMESDVTKDDLLESDEIWCCSSTNAVVPIVRVDEHTIGSGKAGNISLLTHKITREFIRDY